MDVCAYTRVFVVVDSVCVCLSVCVCVSVFAWVRGCMGAFARVCVRVLKFVRFVFLSLEVGNHRCPGLAVSFCSLTSVCFVIIQRRNELFPAL